MKEAVSKCFMQGHRSCGAREIYKYDEKIGTTVPIFLFRTPQRGVPTV